MYSFDIKDHLDRDLKKLAKRNPKQLEIIYDKIDEIIQNPNHYKNLKKPMQHLKRVHIGSFVLLFSVNETEKKVIFEELDHHDSIYK